MTSATCSSVTSIVLAGVGGQGILLASEVLARTALLAGHDVKTNEVHGMAQRGGSVIAQVRMGAKVHSPLVAPRTAAVLASFEKVEAVRNAPYLADGGLAVVADFELVPVTVSSGRAVYPADMNRRLARVFPKLALIDVLTLAQQAGDPRTANLVLLGALSTGLDLPPSAWEESIRRTVKPQFVQMNLKAFELGAEHCRSAMARLA